MKSQEWYFECLEIQLALVDRALGRLKWIVLNEMICVVAIFALVLAVSFFLGDNLGGQRVCISSILALWALYAYLHLDRYPKAKMAYSWAWIHYYDLREEHARLYMEGDELEETLAQIERGRAEAEKGL